MKVLRTQNNRSYNILRDNSKY